MVRRVMSMAAVLAVVCSCLLATAAPDAAQDRRALFVVLLTKGPTWSADPSPRAAALEQQQSDYLRRLQQGGSVALAGPVLDDTPLRALLIVRAEDAAGATRVVDATPGVQAGRLAAEVLPLTVRSDWFTVQRADDNAPQHRFIVALLDPAAATTAATAGNGAGAGAADAEEAFIGRLRDNDVIVLAGWLDSSGRRRRLLVFPHGAVADVRATLGLDPAVQGGQVKFELHPWYAPDRVMTAVR